MRWFWIGSGFIALAIGAVGAVLPVLPTTPFILLAAACFSRGSERWHRWLRENRRFGPLLRDWEQYRAIRARARLLAIVMIVCIGVPGLAFIPIPAVRIGVALTLAIVVLYVGTRPDPPEDETARPDDGGAEIGRRPPSNVGPIDAEGEDGARLERSDRSDATPA